MKYIAFAVSIAVLLFLAVETVIQLLKDLHHYEESKNYWKKLEGPK